MAEVASSPAESLGRARVHGPGPFLGASAAPWVEGPSPGWPAALPPGTRRDDSEVMNTTLKLKQGSVVVGVDGSPASEAAVEWAVRYATARRRPLAIVKATGDPGDSVEILGSAEARRVLRTKARRITD